MRMTGRWMTAAMFIAYAPRAIAQGNEATVAYVALILTPTAGVASARRTAALRAHVAASPR